MRWFAPKRTPVTSDAIFDQYAAALESESQSGITVYDLSELPADKNLIKAVLLQKAYEFGPEANEICKAGFVQLAAFQEQPNGSAESQMKIADEMLVLINEWDARVRFAGAAK